MRHREAQPVVMNVYEYRVLLRNDTVRVVMADSRADAMNKAWVNYRTGLYPAKPVYAQRY
jgi:hypothetical protein